MVAKTFIDFNGIVAEKYDVTRPIDPHKNEAEYGNQGSDFKGVAREVRYRRASDGSTLVMYMV